MVFASHCFPKTAQKLLTSSHPEALGTGLLPKNCAGGQVLNPEIGLQMGGEKPGFGGVPDETVNRYINLNILCVAGKRMFYDSAFLRV